MGWTVTEAPENVYKWNFIASHLESAAALQQVSERLRAGILSWNSERQILELLLGMVELQNCY